VTALESLVAAYERPSVPDEGVVGYIGADVPREVIVAAGLHPLRLRGSVPTTNGAGEGFPKGSVPGIKRADEILGPGVAAPARAVLAGLLEGCPRVDFVLLCHDSDSTVRLFTALRALARTEPLPELWFLDLLHLPNETSGAYNGDRVGEFLDVLGRWSGRPVAVDDIETATRALDETRRRLEELADLRRASPPQLRGSDALAVAGATESLPAAEANRLLKDLLAEARDPLSEPARRVYVTGSEPTITLYRALEGQGLHLVGEGPAGHGGPNARAAFVAREAAAAGADLVLAWIRRGDDALAWGVPALRRAVHLPLFVLDRQDEEPTADDLEGLA
jgi:benzoyl-CoA reductase/2-hydroxyglutaryl-CoA dehydratase subunit BcrC/BadD/HgdB